MGRGAFWSAQGCSQIPARHQNEPLLITGSRAPSPSCRSTESNPCAGHNTSNTLRCSEDCLHTSFRTQKVNNKGTYGSVLSWVKSQDPQSQICSCLASIVEVLPLKSQFWFVQSLFLGDMTTFAFLDSQ